MAIKFFASGLEEGHLLTAGRAPSGPEVEDDGLATQFDEVIRLAGDGIEGEGGGEIAGEGGCGGVSLGRGDVRLAIVVEPATAAEGGGK